MDKLDTKILQILDWNARLPNNKIAKKVRSNKDVVAYRIKKLEKEGIIKRYFPVIDMGKLGYITSRFYFDIEEMNLQKEKEFIDFLDTKINAALIFRMDYPYKYGIVFWVKSIHEIQDTIVKIKEKLGKSLIKYDHTLFCTFRQYPKDYLFNKKHHEKSYSLDATSQVEINKTDFTILRELAHGARKTATEIAKKVKLPQTTVSSKIRNLEKKKIILGYRAEIDFIKLGFMNYFLEIYLEDNNRLKEIESFANAHPNTVWLQKIVGACDIEIEVEVKDRVALESLLQELRKRFPEIRKIVFWSQEYKKFTFLP